MKRKLILSSLGLCLLFMFSLYLPIPKQKLNPAPLLSLRILDREDNLLREVLSDEGGRARWVSFTEVSPDLIKATIAAEDRRFFWHRGISIPAIARAALQNLKSGQIISGASTISQQLIRNIYHFRRNIISKIMEAWLALRLENTLSKKDILVQYLNRISYGNQAYGCEAAAQLYFDKSAEMLSLAESAFLAGIPRSPSGLNPYMGLQLVVQRQRFILHQMLDLGFVDLPKFNRSTDEPLQMIPNSLKFRAPHFCDFILSQYSSAEKQKMSIIRSTIDYSLQRKIEMLVKNHVSALKDKGITNASAVVVDNLSGEILSMVGSKDFFSSQDDGQVNGALSLRQPGSALKPFTYGLALERGMTAAEIIDDSSVQYSTPNGAYRPRNYDKKFHGPVRLRTALACSYNVPAVRVLESLGPEALYYQLKDMGFNSLNQGPGYYGIGLTLGNGEVTLLELVQAYASLARAGEWLESNAVLQVYDSKNIPQTTQKLRKTRKVFSPQVAYILTHILSDHDARIPAFGYNSSLSLPFPCAVKTGTSKDFRDNWTIGYTPSFTVGVWVGNFDGRPMLNVSGVTGCGPLFRDIMLTLENKNPVKEFMETEGLIKVDICPESGYLAGKNCSGSMTEIFILGTEPTTPCPLHVQNRIPDLSDSKPLQKDLLEPDLIITFPKDGDIFKIDPILRQGYQKLQFVASAQKEFHIDKLEWYINGKKEAETGTQFSYSWKLQPGLYTITVHAQSESRVLKSFPVFIRVLE
ncbi:MAG: penicillin-binding protein 1C [Candidatus Aminicenantes bacterium]|nr:penicillin-binding protein 1C [Candidatus Aminicenantes bacterium]